MKAVKIEKSWYTLLKNEWSKEYFIELMSFVDQAYENHQVYPARQDVFKAFELSPVSHTKVILIGQDPYHNANQAHGLCFSVPIGQKIPPSLKNILQEIKQDIGSVVLDTGDLTHWAKQGVLMLNATLTVQAHRAGSHQNKGWEKFTNSVIRYLSEKKESLVFILWGKYAYAKGKHIRGVHLILHSAHPSPLAAYRGFFGACHFSKTNSYLKQNGHEPIDW